LQQSRSYLFLLLVVVLSLASWFLYTQRDYQFGLDVKGGVRFTYEMDVEGIPEGETAGTVQRRLVNILTNRAAGPLGVTEPIIMPKGEREIIVELPGLRDQELAREIMSTTASLEWYHATNVATEQAQFREYRVEPRSQESAIPEVHFQRRSDGQVLTPDMPEYQRMIQGWRLILQGDELARAEREPYGPGNYIPAMIFSPEGAAKMEQWTRENTYRGEMLAAVLDGRVISIAPLHQGAIIRDRGVITGTFEPRYVQNLVELLNAGALPVTLTETSSSTVDPSIGEYALDRMVTAGVIALAFLGLFLLVYYAFPGLIALVALVLYLLFTLTVLKWANTTFSLAAIAGFVLSVAMAVDANILVFERLKEELKAGKDLGRAIDLGFKRALGAIIDGNACTILTSIVLFNLGTGPVKGFASTLIIGVAISLFTAIFITRSLLVFSVNSGLGANPKWYAIKRGWFGERLESGAKAKPLQIVNHAKRYFIISGAIIVPGLIFILMGGIRPNVEFRGGYQVSVNAPADLTLAEINRRLAAAGVRGAQVKFEDAAEGRLAVINVPREAVEDLLEHPPVPVNGATPAPGAETQPGAQQPGAEQPGATPPGAAVGEPPAGQPAETPPAEGQPAEGQPEGGQTGASLILDQEKRTLYAQLQPPTEPPLQMPPIQDPPPGAEPPAAEPPAAEPPVAQTPATDPPATEPPAEGQPAPMQEPTPQERTPGPGARVEVPAAQRMIAEAAGFTAADIRGGDFVGAAVQQETIRNAILGVIISAVLIVLYLAIRFGFALGGLVVGLRFAGATIGALIHDLLVVLGLAGITGYLFGWEISALFISAVLTVIGFSTHDTIVIFDRIRENLHKPVRGEEIDNLLNRSVTQSLARSINTSATTVVVLGILMVVGSPTHELRLFNAAMLIGIATGTFSSLFNAAPILYLWDRAVARKKGEDETMLGLATAQAKARLAARTTEELRPATATGPVQTETGQYGQIRRRRSSEQPKRQDDDD
jgi:protein-export membrane protein SecD/preprotein translocase SecF subunit